MTAKDRVNRLFALAAARVRTKSAAGFTRRFLAAHARGKVLCKDGKERPFLEWLKTAPPEAREWAVSDGLLPDEADAAPAVIGLSE
jgi:hypothetical protein